MKRVHPRHIHASSKVLQLYFALQLYFVLQLLDYYYSSTRHDFSNPFSTALPVWGQITWNYSSPIEESVQCYTKSVDTTLVMLFFGRAQMLTAVPHSLCSRTQDNTTPGTDFQAHMTSSRQRGECEHRAMGQRKYLYEISRKAIILVLRANTPPLLWRKSARKLFNPKGCVTLHAMRYVGQGVLYTA